MSTHGRGGLGRLVFGSVADKVMRAATVPVVLVRDDGKRSPNGLRNLLVPLDGSELAEAMLPLAVEMARDSGAALHLIRVVEPFWTGQYVAYAPEAVYLSSEQIAELEAEAQAEARTYLDDTATGLRSQDIRVVWEVRVGKPADEIVRAAQTTDADLILMSSHGRGGLRRWAFGSVANEVLHRGIVPVMIMPQHLLAEQPAIESVATSADG
jgi:nucleotide-binding universal stress UspA family protein